MAVHVTLRGRLGNNLFQYALARLVARTHDLALHAIPAQPAPSDPGFHLVIDGPSTLAALAPSCFPAVALEMPGRVIQKPCDQYVLGRPRTWDGQTIDIDRALNVDRRRGFKLDGFFQRIEYYLPFVRDIRAWFQLRSPDIGQDVRDRDVLVNIRRGVDYASLGWILPAGHYRRVLRSMNNLGNVYVCGTGVDAACQEHLEEFRPIYFDGSVVEQFAFIQKFRRVVLSNSTFCWWATWLSDAVEIYGPAARCTAYAFSGFPGVDLNMRDPRYIEVPFHQTVDATIVVRPNWDGGQQLEELLGRVEPRNRGICGGVANWLAAQDSPVDLRKFARSRRQPAARRALGELISAGLVTWSHTLHEPPS